MPTRVGPRIRMCRGCCCGTTRKHPDVDHEGIAEILTHDSGPDTEGVRTEFLWACELSNVVVVNPSTLNDAGVCGAALADLGLPIPLLRGFALLARTAGLIGQLAEEMRHPVANDVFLSVDLNNRPVAPDPYPGELP